jgi:hypothetical protein
MDVDQIDDRVMGLAKRDLDLDSIHLHSDKFQKLPRSKQLEILRKRIPNYDNIPRCTTIDMDPSFCIFEDSIKIDDIDPYDTEALNNLFHNLKLLIKKEALNVGEARNYMSRYINCNVIHPELNDQLLDKQLHSDTHYSLEELTNQKLKKIKRRESVFEPEHKSQSSAGRSGNRCKVLSKNNGLFEKEFTLQDMESLSDDEFGDAIKEDDPRLV